MGKRSAIVASVQEENDLLASEIDRLKSELEAVQEKAVRPGVIGRIIAKIFGEKIYDGLKVCGQCRYWDSPRRPKEKRYYSSMGKWAYPKGDCKLLFDKENTRSDETCHMFTPRRRYMRRAKKWSSRITG